MGRDLVSIIMPSYNCGKYVEYTIRSVQAQTYQNWEIIFIDDCSTDNTIRQVSKLREKDSRIHLYQNIANMGAAVSRNNALREAKGRWIAYFQIGHYSLRSISVVGNSGSKGGKTPIFAFSNCSATVEDVTLFGEELSSNNCSISKSANVTADWSIYRQRGQRLNAPK